MATSVRNSLIVLLLVACAGLTGCSSDGKAVIEGTVTWNGEPIKKGNIEVNPTSGPGQTDGADIVDGKFKLRTNEGEKRVAIRADKEIGMTKPSQREPTPRPIYLQYIPEEYNDNSTLTMMFSGGEPLAIDLKGKERSNKPTAGEAARRAAQGRSNEK